MNVPFSQQARSVKLKFNLSTLSFRCPCVPLCKDTPHMQYNTIQYNTIILLFHLISYEHSQNAFINMFNINTKNDISFSIMLNKRSI